MLKKPMDDDLPPEELDRRARELARKVMSQPYRKQEWPSNATPARSDASNARKSEGTDAAS